MHAHATLSGYFPQQRWLLCNYRHGISARDTDINTTSGILSYLSVVSCQHCKRAQHHRHHRSPGSPLTNFASTFSAIPHQRLSFESLQPRFRCHKSMFSDQVLNKVFLVLSFLLFLLLAFFLVAAQRFFLWQKLEIGMAEWHGRLTWQIDMEVVQASCWYWSMSDNALLHFVVGS